MIVSNFYYPAYSHIQLFSNIPWGEQDSNLRKHTLTELQSVPFGHSGISPKLILRQISRMFPVKVPTSEAFFVLRRCKINRFFFPVKYSLKKS